MNSSEFLRGKLSPEASVYFMEGFYYDLGLPMPRLSPSQNEKMKSSFGENEYGKQLLPAPFLDFNERREIVENAFEGLEFGNPQQRSAYIELLDTTDSTGNPVKALLSHRAQKCEEVKGLVVPNPSETSSGGGDIYTVLAEDLDNGSVYDDFFCKDYVVGYFTEQGQLLRRLEYIDHLLEKGQAIKSDEDGRAWVFPIMYKSVDVLPNFRYLSTPEALLTRLILRTQAKHEQGEMRAGPGHSGFEIVNENVCAFDDNKRELEKPRGVVAGAMTGLHDGGTSFIGVETLIAVCRPPAIYMLSLEVDDFGEVSNARASSFRQTFSAI